MSLAVPADDLPQAPVAGMPVPAEDLPNAPAQAHGIWQSMIAGFQESGPGLFFRGKMPDITLDAKDSAWYERAAKGITQTGLEIPEMIVGGTAGAAFGGGVGTGMAGPGGAVVGGIVGGGAGMFAVPAAIREALIQGYTKGDVTSVADFLSRTAIILKEAGKGAVAGAVTSGAGALAARGVGSIVAPMVGDIGVKTATNVIGAADTAAQVAGMTVTPAVLEGRLPEPQDILDAAIVIGGVKAAHYIAPKIAEIYSATGKTPAEVVADAKTDPNIALDLKPVEAPSTAEPMVTVYHGSPYQFNEFDSSKIGTGEGAQAYGHGLYFAENPSVANDYARGVAGRKGLNIDGSPVAHTTAGFAETAMANMLSNRLAAGLMPEAAKAQTLEWANAHPQIGPEKAASIIDRLSPPKPNLYKVQIPQSAVDNMLDWDKPLSEQPEVMAKLQKLESWPAIKSWLDSHSSNLPAGQEANGGLLHEALDNAVGKETTASVLKDAGIAGIKYLDQDSRAEGKGTRNYVLFDPQNARVIERNGKTIDTQNVNDPLGEYGTEIPRAYQGAAAAEEARNAFNGEKAQTVLDSPLSDLPDTKLPYQVNLKYVTGPDGLKALMTSMSEAYRQDIDEQRGGTQSHAETEAKAEAALNDLTGGLAAKVITGREPGTAANAVELKVRGDLLMQSTVEAAAAIKAYNDAKANGTATDQMKLDALEAIHKSAMIQAEFTGAASEVGRALEYMKRIKDLRTQGENIRQLVDAYGGDPDKLLSMAGEINTPEGMAKFAKGATKATVWEKVIEAWKAGILSGPVTHMANIVGNSTFLAMRPIVDLGASLGGSVSPAEPFGRIFGNLQGAKDALKFTGAALRSAYNEGGIKGLAKQIAVGQEEQGPQKVEQFRKAIPGATGDVVRLPFRALSLADDFFKVMNDQGERYALATRQALGEGFNLQTREFRERVMDLVQNDADIAKQGEAAALRLTFNTPLGPKGQAVQDLVRKAKLQLLVPFIRTPGNIFKEMIRMTPLAPIIGEWRAAYEAGGAEKAKAISEMAMGTAISGVVASWVLDGSISGQGSPDPAKRRAAQAAGWQPYSIKIGKTWYSYQRLQPLGTLMGMAADLTEVWQNIDEDQGNKAATMLSVAFANAVTQQTFLQGITNIVQVLADPDRYGPQFVQQYAGSVIPAIVAQPTAMYDPIQREINGIVDAVKARIPGERQTLQPKVNPLTGKAAETKERLGGVMPITETQESTDPVLSEARRLGVGVSATPKSIQLAAAGQMDIGKVKLTPEQRTAYAEASGKTIYQALQPIVNSDSWNSYPDMVKKAIYKKAVEIGHEVGNAASISIEQRIAEAQRIAGEVNQRLHQ